MIVLVTISRDHLEKISKLFVQIIGSFNRQLLTFISQHLNDLFYTSVEKWTRIDSIVSKIFDGSHRFYFLKTPIHYRKTD